MNIYRPLLILLTSTLLVACGSSSDNTEQTQPDTSNGNGNGTANSSSSSSSSAPDEPAFDLSLIPEAPTPTPHDEIPEGNDYVYIAPEGSDQNPGDASAPWRSLMHAAAQVAPGDVIVVRGGVYDETATQRINQVDGTAEAPIIVINYPGEEPVFDFSQQGFGNHGIRLDSDHWHLVGLKIRYAGHNGIRIDGSHNRIERFVVHSSGDTGIHVSGRAAHNLIMNNDSYHNFDPAERYGENPSQVGNNADGFGAKGGNLGPGNLFYGNRAWENSDDGFDFWEARETIILYNNWAFNNGDPSVFGNPGNFDGGGNGFKLGRTDAEQTHIVYRNLAFDNRGPYNNSKGFDQNSNTGQVLVAQNTAFNNPRNFSFPGNGNHIFWNNLNVEGGLDFHSRHEREANSWQIGETIDTSVFLSVDTSLAYSARQPDGSLPDIDLLKPAPGSVIIDAGLDLGRPFKGEAPDLGAYEYSGD